MHLSALLVGMFVTLQEEPKGLPPGKYIVDAEEAVFYKGPGRMTGIARKVLQGEEVQILSWENRWHRVRFKDGVEAYSSGGFFTPPEKFKVSSSDEKRVKELTAQGYEATRGFDKETEEEYRRSKGSATDQAFQKVDALEKKPPVRLDREALERALAEFRRQGKLGEHSPVR